MLVKRSIQNKLITFVNIFFPVNHIFHGSCRATLLGCRYLKIALQQIRGGPKGHNYVAVVSDTRI